MLALWCALGRASAIDAEFRLDAVAAASATAIIPTAKAVAVGFTGI